MKVCIRVSARHVHLSREDVDCLFGQNYKLTVHRELTQPGDFAATETVTLKTEKGMITGVRVVGPVRDKTQVEISKTDSYLLGLNPPVRNSGNLDGASTITIIGPKGEITKNCCIISARHIHFTTQQLKALNLKKGQLLKVKVDTIKGGVMSNVYVENDPSVTFEMHIDLDDANSHLLKDGDFGEIIFK